MAILTEAVQAQSSFPQIAQQYAAANERRRVQNERDQEKAQAQREKVAKEQGIMTAGVQGLQSYPALFTVAQQMYDDYNKAEESGNAEEAEMVKGQLAKFIDGAAAFARSEQTQFNNITGNLDELGKYDNSVEEINGILESRRNRQYAVKREGNSYTIVDDGGNSFGLFEMPELAGQSFVGELSQKSAIPSYMNAISFGERRASAILGRNDVVDSKTGKIIDKDVAKSVLAEDLRLKITQSPEFLDGMIYDYQSAKGEMDRYNPEEIARLKSDPTFVQMVKDEYTNSSLETVTKYESPITKTVEKDSKIEAISNIPVVNGVADFSKYGESVRFFNAQGGMTTINQISVDPSGGLKTKQYRQSGTDSDGNPIMKEADVTIARGSDEYDRLAAFFGGEKYLKQLLKRVDAGAGM
jgi:hypothetical protein